MRSHLVLLPLLGALLGGVTASGDAELNIRQVEETSSTGGGGGQVSSTTEEEVPPSSTSEEAPPPGTTSTGGGNDDEDTTVTITTTVSGDGDTITSATTRLTTVVTTVFVTSTIFETETVTDSDQDTATTTIYETSTVWSTNRRRGLDSPIRTLPLEPVEAILTAADAEPTAVDIKAAYYDMMRREALPLPAAGLEKRATITEVVTETEGGDGAETVVNTVTRTVLSTTSDETTVTETITETEVANAITTISVTSTLTVTSTSVGSGIETQTGTTEGGDSGGGGSGGGGDDSGSSLSTGAIAGIAVGGAVAGLAILGALLWFCLKKRRNANKFDADDTLPGGSEVPVGGAAGAGGYSSHNRTPSMSQNLSSGGGAIGETPRREPVLPNLTSPEGYRGTAMGAGRAGYAKTDNYGGSYAPASSNTNTMTSSAVSPYSPTNRSSTLGGDQLPEHPAPGGMTGLAAVGHQGRSVSPYSETPYSQPPPQQNEPQAAELGSDGGGARWQNQGAAELGSDGGGARWQNQGAAEIDSQPARRRTSGPLYEMP